MKWKVRTLSAALILSCAAVSRALPQGDLEAMRRRAEVSYREVPRKVLAFYYPWYGNPAVKGGSGRWSHWEGVDQAKKEIRSSTNYPVLGPYDSHDPELVDSHCEWAKRAGVDGLILSWWGKGSFTDQAVKLILERSRQASLEVTVYYETVPRPRNAGSAAKDILELLELHGGHEAWLKVDGKPVIFVYGRAVGEIGLLEWLKAIDAVNRAYKPGAVFFGDKIDPAASRVFDGVHTYNTAGSLRGRDPEEARAWAGATYKKWVEVAERAGRMCAVTVIPGYDDTKIRKPGLAVKRFEGKLYAAQWEEALSADPHWILITSWNEWHEGSEIEPSAEYGDKYIEMTAAFARRFKATPKAPRRKPPSTSGISPDARKRLRSELEDVAIAVLPGSGSTALWWLLEHGARLRLLSWEEIVRSPLSPDRFPVLLYASGEHYRASVGSPGDVDRALLRYLREGGFLAVLPSDPMPFYYAGGRAVDGSRKLGLPLSVGGARGGWEMPPRGANLRFVQRGGSRRALSHLPESFPFPKAGDLRWRPFVAADLEDGDHHVTLLELRDGEGKNHGGAVAYIERRKGDAAGGRILYAWFGLLDGPYGDALLFDLFRWLVRKLGEG